MKYIGYLVTFVFVIITNSIIGGWTFSVLWNWFVSGLFGLPILTTSTAIGLILVFNFITPDTEQKGDDSDSSIGTKLFEAAMRSIFRSIAALGIGWIVLQFI